jgi:hypothetical protein
MKRQFTSLATAMYLTGINYKIGDDVVPKDNPNKIYGKCTGFKNGCILIDGRNYGGMYFFMKSEWQDPEIL